MYMLLVSDEVSEWSGWQGLGRGPRLNIPAPVVIEDEPDRWLCCGNTHGQSACTFHQPEPQLSR